MAVEEPGLHCPCLVKALTDPVQGNGGSGGGCGRCGVRRGGILPVLTAAGNPTASQRADRVVKVPRGTSKYQAAWIVEDKEGSDEDGDVDDDMDDDMMEEAASQVLL